MVRRVREGEARQATRQDKQVNQLDLISLAANVLETEAQAILAARTRLGQPFADAIGLLLS
jgi:hypothetical protein